MTWFKHRPRPKDGVSYHPNKNTPVQRALWDSAKNPPKERNNKLLQEFNNQNQ